MEEREIGIPLEAPWTYHGREYTYDELNTIRSMTFCMIRQNLVFPA